MQSLCGYAPEAPSPESRRRLPNSVHIADVLLKTVVAPKSANRDRNRRAQTGRTENRQRLTDLVVAVPKPIVGEERLATAASDSGPRAVPLPDVSAASEFIASNSVRHLLR